VKPDKVLEAAGTSLANVVKVGVFLRDMKDFDTFNQVFREYFKGVQPARTTVEAAAPRKGVSVVVRGERRLGASRAVKWLGG